MYVLIIVTLVVLSYGVHIKAHICAGNNKVVCDCQKYTISSEVVTCHSNIKIGLKRGGVLPKFRELTYIDAEMLALFGNFDNLTASSLLNKWDGLRVLNVLYSNIICTRLDYLSYPKVNIICLQEATSGVLTTTTTTTATSIVKQKDISVTSKSTDSTLPGYTYETDISAMGQNMTETSLTPESYVMGGVNTHQGMIIGASLLAVFTFLLLGVGIGWIIYKKRHGAINQDPIYIGPDAAQAMPMFVFNGFADDVEL